MAEEAVEAAAEGLQLGQRAARRLRQLVRVGHVAEHRRAAVVAVHGRERPHEHGRRGVLGQVQRHAVEPELPRVAAGPPRDPLPPGEALELGGREAAVAAQAHVRKTRSSRGSTKGCRLSSRSSRSCGRSIAISSAWYSTQNGWTKPVTLLTAWAPASHVTMATGRLRRGRRAGLWGPRSQP